MLDRLSLIVRTILGGACVVVMLVWAVVTIPTVTSGREHKVSALLDVTDLTAPPQTAPKVAEASATRSEPSERVDVRAAARDPSADGAVNVEVSIEPRGFDVDPLEHTVIPVGCVDAVDASTMHEFVRNRLGPLVGWDNPHIYPIDEHRSLWIVHDSYLDYTGTAASIGITRPQLQNLVILQEGTCFTLVHGGTPDDGRENFEIGEGHSEHTRFLWPLGGEVQGDRLWLFWSETVLSESQGKYGQGVVRHPEKVWLASYDIDTLERLSFEEAPNSGVFPSYGFAVESDDEYSYLFGNSNLLNFEREGGYENGPHSATKMFLARVPLGQFDTLPEYWNGSEWTNDPTQSVPISERYWAENTMQPRYIAGRWVSVVKRDGFFGNEIVVDVAEHPWGPWEVAERIPYDPQDEVPMNSYHPIIAPWSSPETGLIIVVSENAQHWKFALDRLDLYRPAVLTARWPFPEDLDERSGVSADPHG